jgi:glycosyltransferase involved in cell wall biosynthesis
LPLASAVTWLSVLVPVHDAERYLRACVESILTQRAEGIELVLLDDASRDGSLRVAQALRDAHPGVVRIVRHARNLGPSGTRNRLLQEARGTYIWFLDSDDVMLPGALATLRGIVEREAPDLVLCDFRVLRERFGLRHQLRGEGHRCAFRGRPHRLCRDRSRLMDGLMRDGLMHVWTKIGRASLWRQVRFPAGRRLMEDAPVVPVLVAAADSYYYVPEPWVGYRQHGESALATPDAGKLHDMLESIRDFSRAARAVPDLDRAAEASIERCSLQMLAAAARRMRAPTPELIAHLGQTREELFPRGIDDVLAGFRRVGWWWRGARVRRSLSRLAAQGAPAPPDSCMPTMLSRR